MKIPRFSNAIGNLDEDLVEAAAECKKKQNHLLKLGSIAACFAVIIVVGALVLPSLLGGEPTPGGTNDRYKDINIMAGESGIVWPWEYQTVFEKYTEVTIDGIVYRSHGRLVSEELLGDLIGTYTVYGIKKQRDKWRKRRKTTCTPYLHNSRKSKACQGRLPRQPFILPFT